MKYFMTVVKPGNKPTAAAVPGKLFIFLSKGRNADLSKLTY